jgi:hypothetical protein
MKITARAVQALFTVTDEAGNTVAEYSVENMNFVTDISGLLKCVSQASHLFKQLDASHNVDVDVAVNTQGERERIGPFERSRAVQKLLDACSDFQTATQMRVLADTQHDCCMELYAASKLVRRDASVENVAELVKAARGYCTSFCEVGDKLSPREIRYSTKLLEAINAI